MEATVESSNDNSDMDADDIHPAAKQAKVARPEEEKNTAPDVQGISDTENSNNSHSESVVMAEVVDEEEDEKGSDSCAVELVGTLI